MKKKRLVGFDLNGVATYEGDLIEYIEKSMSGAIKSRTLLKAKLNQRKENYYKIEHLNRRCIVVKNDEAFLVKVRNIKTGKITYEVLDIYGKPTNAFRKDNNSETLVRVDESEIYFDSI